MDDDVTDNIDEINFIIDVSYVDWKMSWIS